MAWNSPFQDVANSKPLFLTIYATVIAGAVFTSFYVPSAATFSAWLSTPSAYHHSLPLTQVANSSHSTVVAAVLAPLSNVGKRLTKPIWEVPSGSKMPPLKAFRLTKELVEERVKDNVIIATFGNYAFMDFILTWVKHFTDLGLDNLLVGAMDTKLLEALYWKGVPVFDMGSHMNTIDAGWGSPTFHKMGREKNPLPYLARFPEADILTSTDQVAPTVPDDRLDIWQRVGAAYNIGIFHWRPSHSSKKLAKEWKDLLLADDEILDQNAFNDLIHRQLGPSVDEESGLAYVYDGNLKLGLLPASIFCSGHTFFVQAMYQQLRLEPYAVHTTFQCAGTGGKHHRLRGFMTKIYAGGFMTFKPSIPKSLLLDGEHNVESHFSLVNYQIQQIRTALAIASLLNRTLVMPPLWCRLDRLWFPHPGVLVGTMTRQPFICPSDHVFEVNVMLKKMPEEEFGPGISFREYSFFDNPKLPNMVKDSWIDVHLCQEGSQNCQASNDTNPMGTIKFPKHSNEGTLTLMFFITALGMKISLRIFCYVICIVPLTNYKD